MCTNAASGAIRIGSAHDRVLRFRHILKWVDAHANLPARARWIAKADVAPGVQPSGLARRPSMIGGYRDFDQVH